MRYVGVMSVVLLVLFCGGCKNVDTPPAAISMAGGRVEGVFSKTVPEITETARSLLVGQKLMLVQYKSDAASGKIVAYTRDSERIEIEVRPDAKGSHVTITTGGTAGDQVSMNLLNAMREAR